MYMRSTLTLEQASAVVELFENGFTARSVSLELGLARNSVQMLYERWQVRGPNVLATRERVLHSLDTKLAVVRRHLAGETGRSLAQEFDLPSPGTVSNWAKIYRRDGEDGLRPKPRGRPARNTAAPIDEIERLRQENERLHAEVAYLGKLRALRPRGQR